MVTMQEIRKELQDVRYYYKRKEAFDKMLKNGNSNTVLGTVAKYAEVLKTAPQRLLDTYYGLYVENKTQEAFASDLGFSPEYIRRWNAELLTFLQKELSKNGR